MRHWGAPGQRAVKRENQQSESPDLPSEHPQVQQKVRRSQKAEQKEALR